MKKIKYFLLLVLLGGCSLFKSSDQQKIDLIDLSNKPEYMTGDYLDQMKSLESSYLETEGNKKINLSKSSINYFNSIIEQIQKNNELFFNNSINANLTIIDSEVPFHFSLPGKSIFVSSGLINKYIKSEKLLYCLIIYELIRSEKGIYRKQIVVPTGFYSTEKMLSTMRLSISDKVEIHKWAFYLLKRIGIDTDNYLSWLQIQNRNSVDFSMQLGDLSVISREESLFKAFIIKNTGKKSVKYHAGSSRGFYRFIRNIKR
jgi:hypothetical protein